METLHYLPTELTLPSTASPEDLDWVAFCWTLICGRRGDVGWPMVQVVLAPGVMLNRWIVSKDGTNPFVFGSPMGSWHRQSSEGDQEDMTTEAVKYTDALMSKGYGWECIPFSSDFRKTDTDELVRKVSGIRMPDQPVNTLGDAALHGDEAVLSVIFTHLSTERERLGR